MESHAIEITNARKKQQQQERWNLLKSTHTHTWNETCIREKVWTTLTCLNINFPSPPRREEWNKLFSIEKTKSALVVISNSNLEYFIFMHCKQMRLLLLLFNGCECKNELSKWHALLTSLRVPFRLQTQSHPVLWYVLCALHLLLPLHYFKMQ